jgi:hypothetical protein
MVHRCNCFRSLWSHQYKHRNSFCGRYTAGSKL